MNANEVIAKGGAAAGGSVRQVSSPNDHVNAGQSSNDVIPTAMQVAACIGIRRTWCPRWSRLRDSLAGEGARVRPHREVRPHAPDGRDAGAARPGVRRLRRAGRPGIERLEAAERDLAELPLGGTAVGTGINTHPRVRGGRSPASAAHGHRVQGGANHFERQGTRDTVVYAHGALNTLAVSLMRIANDIRLARQRAARRPERDHAAVDPAGIEHHAGQGEPGDSGGRDDGRRAGDGQPHDDHGGRAGQLLRAERDDAGDGARAAPVDLAAVERARVLARSASTASRRTRIAAANCWRATCRWPRRSRRRSATTRPRPSRSRRSRRAGRRGRWHGSGRSCRRPNSMRCWTPGP
jgi:hypothetical protein